MSSPLTTTPSAGSGSHVDRPIVRLTSGHAPHAEQDSLAVEEPLEIRIGPEPLAVTLRTPGDDESLAAGFCWTEGIVEHPDEIERIDPCSMAEYGNIVVVTVADEVQERRQSQIARSAREMYRSSSCGLCGKQSIERLKQDILPVKGNYAIDGARLSQLPEIMRAAQPCFGQTGGLHAAALFDRDQRLLAVCEDIGRHNAVDKVIGTMVLRGVTNLDEMLLLVSGRASFEIIQKGAAARIPIIAAVSAPSSLAVDLAKSLNMTLVGFVRPARANIYNDPCGRVLVGEAS